MTDTTRISQASDVNQKGEPLDFDKSEYLPAQPWHQLFRRRQIVQSLEAIQDLIAVSLCVGLFCVMALQLKGTSNNLSSTRYLLM
jgi:hypothetical protein